MARLVRSQRELPSRGYPWAVSEHSGARKQGEVAEVVVEEEEGEEAKIRR